MDYVIVDYFFELWSDYDQQNAETFQRMRVVYLHERINSVHYGFEHLALHE
jgi:hypothetical protein